MKLYQESFPLKTQLAYFCPWKSVYFSKSLEHMNTRMRHSKVQWNILMILKCKLKIKAFRMLNILLTLSTLGKIDNIFKYISYFPQKTGFDISCKLSSMETLCMKYQILFSGNNKTNIINLASDEFAHRMLNTNRHSVLIFFSHFSKEHIVWVFFRSASVRHFYWVSTLIAFLEK